MKVTEALARLQDEIETGKLTPHEVAELLDRRRIEKALMSHGWNQVAAADFLGLHRNTLSRRMEVLGIVVPENAPPKKHTPGRNITPEGEKARGLGMKVRDLRMNGLDRELSPLVMRIRLKQIERAANRTRRVDSLMALSEKVTALEKLGAAGRS